MSYVIIGNGPAAIFAIEGIRSIDQKTPITVISKENKYAYGRPTITYQIAGVIKKENMFLRNEDFYKNNQVQVLLGKSATNIDEKRKIVQLDNGEEILFSKLLIASGGVPFIPPTYEIAMQKNNVMTFIKWEDMEKMESLLPSIEKVMIIGGGLIGIKTAEALVMRGKKVYIAELSNRVLSTVVDAKGAYYFHKEMEKQNITLFLENTVKEFKYAGNQVSSVILNSGEEIKVDAVVVAIGVKPAIDFIKNTSIKINRGILVNDKMETSVKDIYAAGDVAEGQDMVYQDKRLGPIWISASEQGKIAGLNMAGKNESYKGKIIMNAISFMDTKLISYGAVNPELEFKNVRFLEKEIKEKNIYRKLNLNENRLIGAIFVNSFYRKGIITRFFRENLPLEKFQELLLDPEYGFKKFDKNYREKVINA